MNRSREVFPVVEQNGLFDEMENPCHAFGLLSMAGAWLAFPPGRKRFPGDEIKE